MNEHISRVYDFSDLETVKRIISFGAITKNDALRWAAHNGNAETVEYLASIGANLNSLGGWALKWACVNGHFDTVKCLVRLGANVSIRNNIIINTAVRCGRLDIVKFLVENGVNLKHCDVVMVAANEHQFEIVKFLIESGADPNESAGTINSPLGLVFIHNPHFGIFKFLIENGADYCKLDWSELGVPTPNSVEEAIHQFMVHIINRR